jgi:hypothetical protein
MTSACVAGEWLTQGLIANGENVDLFRTPEISL